MDLHELQYLIRNNRFEHFYLFENVLKALNNNYHINQEWIIGDKNSWVLGFCSNNIYNIYGINFTDSHLKKVSEGLNFDTLPNNLVLSGNKEIINYLVKNNPKTQFEIAKERYFYEVNDNSFRPVDVKPNINIRTAIIDDLEILTEYSCRYFEEEYKGQNNKNFDEMKFMLKPQISAGKYIVALIQDSIIGFCSKMETKLGNDMIGTVYVDSENRKSKAGTKLMKEMTKNILSTNPKCWVMTDANHPASNNLMLKLGYRKIYEYIIGEIKKHE